jgi:hypothetical protein
MIAAKSMATLQSGDRGLVETMLVHNMEACPGADSSAVLSSGHRDPSGRNRSSGN